MPCILRNICKHCAQILKNMNFFVSHIYREGNQCVDGLANIGLYLDQFTIWHTIPSSLTSDFILNKLGLGLFLLEGVLAKSPLFFFIFYFALLFLYTRWFWRLAIPLLPTKKKSQNVQLDVDYVVGLWPISTLNSNGLQNNFFNLFTWLWKE